MSNRPESDNLGTIRAQIDRANRLSALGENNALARIAGLNEHGLYTAIQKVPTERQSMLKSLEEKKVVNK